MAYRINKKGVLAYAVVLALMIGGVLILANQFRAQLASEQNPGEGLPKAFTEASHRLSTSDSPEATMVAFMDLECKACSAAFTEIEALRSDYGDRVTFIFRYFPIASYYNSENAAVALEAAARQGRLEDMYVQLFTTQDEWGGQQVSQAEAFRVYAYELGLDLAQYGQDVDSPDVRARVLLDLEEGRAMGVDATPAIYINDVRLVLTSIQDIRAALEAVLNV